MKEELVSAKEIIVVNQVCILCDKSEGFMTKSITEKDAFKRLGFINMANYLLDNAASRNEIRNCDEITAIDLIKESLFN